MLDAATGTLSFDDPPAVFRPTLTRDAFLAGPLAAGARTDVSNEPYHSWRFDRAFRTANIDWLVVVYFNGQQLTALSLTNGDPRFGTSWAEASFEKEMARKARHDQWLTACLKTQRDFQWGSVWSGYDPKSEGSSIVVRYAMPDT